MIPVQPSAAQEDLFVWTRRGTRLLALSLFPGMPGTLNVETPDNFRTTVDVAALDPVRSERSLGVLAERGQLGSVTLLPA